MEVFLYARCALFPGRSATQVRLNCGVCFEMGTIFADCVFVLSPCLLMKAATVFEGKIIDGSFLVTTLKF